MTRARISLAIAGLGVAFVGGRGLWVYLQDGSYFLDAASVVLNLDGRSLVETFRGPLEWGQHFPRVHLAIIRGLRALLGPETWVTRLLPVAAYLGATLLWMRLFVRRFPREPLLVALGVVMVAAAPSWWTYSAVVKQYSLDVFLALAVFSLPDSFLDENLAGRRRGWRALLLVLPVLLSYTYGIALLARVLGWAAFGWRRGRRPRAVPSLVFGLFLAGALGLLWWTDARHTAGQEALVLVWQGCVASQQPPEAWPELLRRFLASWYVGPTEFFFPPKLAAPIVWGLLAAQALGAVRVLRSLVVVDRGDTQARDERGDVVAWGSRSVGGLAALVGAVASSFLIDYPICAGRSTLYLLFFQQMLLLEGLQALVLTGRSSRWTPQVRRVLRHLGPVLLALLVAAIGVHAVRVHRTLAPGLPLEDLRPLLPRVRAEPSLPVLVTPCIQRQLRTLPEGLSGLDLHFLPATGWEDQVPREREVWILHSRLNGGFCERFRRKLGNMTHGFDHPDRPGEQAVVYRATVKSQDELRAQRRRALRALSRAAAEAEARERAGAESGEDDADADGED